MKRPAKVRRVACPVCQAAPGALCTDRGDTRDSNHLARVRAHGRAYPAAPRPGAAGPAGVLAWHDTNCARCDKPITRHGNQVVERKGTWIHVECAPGADDA